MIEAISVCVNYLDFFQITYERNKGFFDHYIVVTDSKDKETQGFCRENGITLVITDVFYKDGAVFNKGLALNEGLKKLKFNKWVSIMDADTILLPEFGEFNFEKADKEKMYGARRAFIRTYEDLVDFDKGKKTLEDFWIPHGFAFGYLQVFHCESEVCKKEDLNNIYPSYPNARESDCMFSSKWGKFGDGYKTWDEKLEIFPFYCISLGEDGPNHFGRVTEKFI